MRAMLAAVLLGVSTLVVGADAPSGRPALPRVVRRTAQLGPVPTPVPPTTLEALPEPDDRPARIAAPAPTPIPANVVPLEGSVVTEGTGPWGPEVGEGAVVEGDVIPEGVVVDGPGFPAVDARPVMPPRPVEARRESPPTPPDYCIARDALPGDRAFPWVLGGSSTLVETLPAPEDANPSTLGNAPRAIVFDGPAEFPLWKFQDIAHRFPAEGLRIDESMSLRLAPDGSYEVEFQGFAPPTPVLVALQFVLTVEGREIGTLSLPPVLLDPRSAARTSGVGLRGDTLDHDLARGWRVVHRGRATVVRRAFDVAGRPIPLGVTRRGVARFGSGVSATRPIYR